MVVSFWDSFKVKVFRGVEELFELDSDSVFGVKKRQELLETISTHRIGS